MEKESILVPVDFSEVTERVLKTAAYYAGRNQLDITLLHVKNKFSPSDIRQSMKQLSAISSGVDYTPKFDLIIRDGNILNEINSESEKEGYRLMVIGSHGYKGLREKILGADILKLLKNISLPCLTIQKNLMMAAQGVKKILFPVGAHSTFMQQIKATIDFVQLSGAVVYIYMVEKPGTTFSDELLNNLQLAEDEFMKNGVTYKKIKEEQHHFSYGFARQIIDFAIREKMDMISIMANAAREHHYIADSDKLLLLTNSSGIPVFTSNDKYRIRKRKLSQGAASL